MIKYAAYRIAGAVSVAARHCRITTLKIKHQLGIITNTY